MAFCPFKKINNKLTLIKSDDYYKILKEKIANIFYNNFVFYNIDFFGLLFKNIQNP